MSPLPHILSVGLLSHWVDVLFALDTPLAADAGFEPAHKGIKVPGLTAWLIGYTFLPHGYRRLHSGHYY